MKRTTTPLLSAVFLCLLLGAPAAHADYLCSYQARISGRDKFNSKGTPVVSGINKSSVAAAIRQDRANYHMWNVRDDEDTGDCAFASTKNRERLQNMLLRGNISKRAMREIYSGTPLIQVDVYTDYVNVRLVDEPESDDIQPVQPPRRSSVN